MTLKSIIVDDEPVARKLLQEYIEDIDFIELAGIAENPLKANAILQSTEVDLIFLDINMPKLTGIEFIKSSTALPMVILETAYAEYATEAFGLDVVDYLVKPFAFERFLKACNKARDYFELKHKSKAALGNDDGYFFVKHNGKIEKVLYNELVYVEAMLNYVVLHTETAKMIVYLTIKSILDQLPPHLFIKVHKSYIINVAKVKSIEGNELNLGKAKVAISQHFYEGAVKEIVKDRMIKR